VEERILVRVVASKYRKRWHVSWSQKSADKKHTPVTAGCVAVAAS